VLSIACVCRFCANDPCSVELAQISDVRGAFNVQSSKDISSDCSHFKSLSGSNNVIKGTYTCVSGASNPSSSGTGSSGSSTSSGSSSSTSSSAADVLYISGATGLMGVVAAIFGML
jgi:hypothetical protein